jgi:hypothetical protein
MELTGLSDDERSRLSSARRRFLAAERGISTDAFESVVNKAWKQASPPRGVELFPLPPRSIRQQEGRS